ncbi:hypothetical protein [Aggregatilinea lenta]|uniref:hypothetical protein n=1 Tax=Aggregatilinea lenta TaxID=913108 RepID=UPI0013C2B397|nr:hypothetical protein [Aggregatilinea lenta]
MNRPARWISLSLVIFLSLGMSGCIKPVSTAEPPTATVPVVVQPPTATLAAEGVPADVPDAAAVEPTAAPVQEEPALPEAQPYVETFVLSRGQAPTDLVVWGDAVLGPDRLLGYAYTGAGGFPCTGFLLVSAAANNGAIACATDPAMAALASTSYISTSDGQPYTIVFGRATDPTITALAVIFDDGSNQTANPSAGGFMVLHADIVSVVVITAINAEGNTVMDNIPQVPAS